MANDNTYDLTLKRYLSNAQCTIGELFDISGFICFTLEDIVREIPGEPVEDWKIPHQTAIPAGRYPVKITYSMRFQKELPLLMAVPGFSGIRIHAGNTAQDTEGCLLVGLKKSDTACSIGQSRDALRMVQARIAQALHDGECYINILNG